MSSGRSAFASFALLASLAAPRLLLGQGVTQQGHPVELSAAERAAAAYQRAAWLATVQLMARNPDPSEVQRYVAYHADSGWVVAFGRLNVARDTFYVSHIAVPAAIGGQRVDSIFEFHDFATPGPDVDFLVRAARAMDTAVIAMGARARDYRAAAIPAENGDWLVYVTPAPNYASAKAPARGLAFRISADADRILETRRSSLRAAR